MFIEATKDFRRDEGKEISILFAKPEVANIGTEKS